MTPRELEVYNYIKKYGYTNTLDISTALGIKAHTQVSTYLKSLVQQGKLRKQPLYQAI